MRDICLYKGRIYISPSLEDSLRSVITSLEDQVAVSVVNISRAIQEARNDFKQALQKYAKFLAEKWLCKESEILNALAALLITQEKVAEHFKVRESHPREYFWSFYRPLIKFDSGRFVKKLLWFYDLAEISDDYLLHCNLGIEHIFEGIKKVQQVQLRIIKGIAEVLKRENNVLYEKITDFEVEINHILTHIDGNDPFELKIRLSLDGLDLKPGYKSSMSIEKFLSQGVNLREEDLTLPGTTIDEEKGTISSLGKRFVVLPPELGKRYKTK